MSHPTRFQLSKSFAVVKNLNYELSLL